LTAADHAAAARGWSAADVDPSELVDDAWIARNCRAGRPPSRARHYRDKIRAAARLRGIRNGELTRDQMRRIAQRTGYPYVEAWSGHNKGAMKAVRGPMCHHTGTAWSAPGDYPTLKVVRDGRAGLENSLSMYGLGKSGTAYLINNKVSWHAGVGAWRGVTDGNGNFAGIEAESDGKNWTPQQVDAYPRLTASILIEVGETTRTWALRHADWAPSRKVDFGGWPGGPGAFWAKVEGYLANPATIHKDHGGGGSGGGGAPGGDTYTVAPGDTLYSIARRFGCTVAALQGWNPGLTTTITPGQVVRVRAAAPPPPPAPAPGARPPALGWTLPGGHFYGNIAGPAVSHGGATPAERAAVKVIQQWLIFRGCVPGVPSSAWASSGWADGRWEGATDAAMTLWHARFYPGQPAPAQCWADDLRRLTA
jgi:LysM repeat protein